MAKKPGVKASSASGTLLLVPQHVDHEQAQLLHGGTQTLALSLGASRSLMCLASPGPVTHCAGRVPLRVTGQAQLQRRGLQSSLPGEPAPTAVPPRAGMSRSQRSWASCQPPQAPRPYRTPCTGRGRLIFSIALPRAPVKSCTQDQIFSERVKGLRSTPVSTIMPQESKNLQFKNGVFMQKEPPSLPQTKSLFLKKAYVLFSLS